ncbi:MAG: rRNA maturation RNase YbeY [Fimbriimonadales bacterium]
MPSIRSLSVALTAASEAESWLEHHWGTEGQERLQHALQEAIESLMRSELQPLAGDQPYEICIYLTTDAEIRALNRAYRGVDASTDVLSFCYWADSNSPPDQPTEGARFDSPILLGDIAISLETAARQAPLNGHDLLTELLMLALHGTLHLMGYDDSTEEERAQMNARAVSTLSGLGYAAREEWYSRYEET